MDPKVNILLVDDRPENLVALAAVLGELGQNLVCVQSGAEALKRLLQEEYAVILMDAQMPDMDGFETASLIRQREKSRDIPIIFLTAINKSDRHVSRGYSVGAVDYVFKPFDPDILKAKVRAFVDLSLKTQALHAEVVQRKRAEEEIRRLNRTLEQRVQQRTEALIAANQKLEREVLERQKFAQEALEARNAAEVASQAKSQFLANMSHELRTPLNAIIGYSEMIQEEMADAGREDFIPDLQRIHAAGKHLLALINDILDLSKIEAGRMELFYETFDVCALIRETATTTLHLIQQNGNTLEVECAEDIGSMHADLMKVRQCLFNLLSNAGKFTEQGKVTLSARREGSASGVRIVFEVRDTGIGIDEEQQGRLFEPFTQVYSSPTRKYGGSGLGLVITRRFCRMMGGDVSLQSRLGEGAAFTMTLPADPREKPPGTEASEEGAKNGMMPAGTVKDEAGLCLRSG